jgi:hypothetical protein
MLCQVGLRVQTHNNAYEDWSIGSKDDERNVKSDQRNCKAKKKFDQMLKEIFNKRKGTHVQKNLKTKKQQSSRWTIMIYLSQHFWTKF